MENFNYDIGQLSKQQQLFEAQQRMMAVQNGHNMMQANMARMERFQRDHMESIRHKQTLQLSALIGMNLFNAICADTPYGSDPGEAEWAIDGNGG